MKRVFYYLLLLPFITKNAYSINSEAIYVMCETDAENVGKFLQSRYDGYSLKQVLDHEKKRVRNAVEKGGFDEDVFNLFFSSNAKLIVEAFDQPFPKSKPDQKLTIEKSVEKHLHKCLKKNMQ